MKKQLNTSLFLLFLLLLIIANCTQSHKPLEPGQKIGDFYLDTLSHERFYLNQQQDKVIVLIFWATWCRACKTEMTELEKKIKLPQWQKVSVAAVCTDPENLGRVKEITHGLKLSYPILLDTKSKLFKKYKLNAWPTTLIINQEQRLSFIRIGYDANVMNQIQSKVVRLIEGR